MSFCTILAACSLSPYPEEFGCEGSTDYGACMSMSDAHRAAVTGNFKGKRLTKDGEVDVDGGELEDSNDGKKMENISAASPAGLEHGLLADEHSRYEAAQYRELRRLVQQDVTPILKPPEVVRTYIVAYEADFGLSETPVLKMGEVIYSAGKPQWVVKGAQPIGGVGRPGEVGEGILVPLMEDSRWDQIPAVQLPTPTPTQTAAGARQKRVSQQQILSGALPQPNVNRQIPQKTQRNQKAVKTANQGGLR